MSRKVVKYAGFDPGLNTGYAYFDENGETIAHGELPYSNVIFTLASLLSRPAEERNNLVIICEDFRLLEQKARQVARNRASRSMEASKVIGALELFALASNINIELQQPEKGTRVAAAWTGLIAPPGQHLANWKSAYNHAIYHMVTKGVLKVDKVRVV